MVRPADLAQGAPDEGDARRGAEPLFEPAAQTGLDFPHLGDEAVRIATLACQRAPCLAALLTHDPHRLARVAADRYLRREKPRAQLVAEVRTWVTGLATSA